MQQLKAKNVIEDRCGVLTTRHGGDKINELNIKLGLQFGEVLGSINVMQFNNI